MDSVKSWRERLYVIIFESNTRAGRLFDEVLIGVILASLLVLMLDSMQDEFSAYTQLFWAFEWGFTAIFAVEYLLRLYCSPKPLRYAFSFYGLVDLLAVLPAFIALIYDPAQYLMVIRILRVLRVFRILKLTHYSSQANLLLAAMRGSQQKITVFFLCILVLVTIFGSLMYAIEGPANGFTSIPKSIYWAIVTLTTVGFGDITPKTPLGQALASVVMISGYSIIAVPTGIFTVEMANAMRSKSKITACPSCAKDNHEGEAAFCSRCGNPLYPRATTNS
jgi:voltage-gated potassium channel